MSDDDDDVELEPTQALNRLQEDLLQRQQQQQQQQPQRDEGTRDVLDAYLSMFGMEQDEATATGATTATRVTAGGI